MTYNMATKLYPYYQDKLIWSAVPGIIVILITVFVGLFGNSNIIIATYRTKKLHTNCCILIAITAFFDIIHQLAHVIFAFRFFTVNYFINLENCYYLQLPFVFAMNFGSFAYLSVGLDRLCCVIFPLRYYDQLNRSYQLPYLLLMIALPTAYSISLLVLAYQRVMQSSTDMVVCFITDVFYEEMQHTWNVVQWITFAVTVTCYCVLWAFIRIKNVLLESTRLSTTTYSVTTI
ncbi:unnamed protein product [Bursaphelenchus okinawaensis]|uniref:G-protein coupled receptors family 1 profile domain-containing protein n=1 Tax=Bursaphelenchus okinawaensis TaxID=465554 RepID=A0A811L797_9BILA|nr:unnamed protein product [Bursaphelenchus okinawaensis]CAG9117145.1 unnamed protein product [Bursaphelenchus okinawaensis]